MFLIAGLGNPGGSYRFTRHNFGFLTLQTLAERHQIVIEKRKFESRYGLGEILHEKVLLLTPLTYMNRSGQAIDAFLRYFQISIDHLVVIHDDLDLSWTRIRIVPKGGAAGHKGILSIIDQLKTQNFMRLRMGIGRPAEKIPSESYVLQSFSAEERKELPTLTAQAGEAIELLLKQGLTTTMNRFNIRKSSDQI